MTPGDVETGLADTPFAPLNLGCGTTAFATENGAEGNVNGFFYLAPNNLFRIGIHVGNGGAPALVPEPAPLICWALVCLCSGGFGTAGHIRNPLPSFLPMRARIVSSESRGRPFDPGRVHHSFQRLGICDHLIHLIVVTFGNGKRSGLTTPYINRGVVLKNRTVTGWPHAAD